MTLTEFDDTLPENIKQLIQRCVINERSFDNDDMSIALHFAEMLWRRLAKMADHYERQSDNWGPMMKQAATDMRHVLNDTRSDILDG